MIIGGYQDHHHNEHDHDQLDDDSHDPDESLHHIPIDQDMYKGY